MEVMQAAILEGLGNFNYKKVEMPVCGEKEVIVGVKRCGICSSDMVRSMKTGFYHYPIIPGHEFCGTVVERGSKVEIVEMGDRVAVYPLIPCKNCKQCKVGHYNLCDNYNFLGSRCNGGYSEYVKCPFENLVKIPEKVTFDEAAMIEPTSVALHGNKIAGRGNSIIIMGLGPIGLMTAQWARIFGAETIIGIDRHDNRFKIAKTLGLDHLIDSRYSNIQEEVNELTNGDGANVVFECSGSDELQKQSIFAAAKDGKIILLGNPIRDLTIDKELFSRIVRRELKIHGSWSSLTSTKEWEESIRYIKEKKINVLPLISHVVHLDDAQQIIDDMFNKRFEFSKVVFNI